MYYVLSTDIQNENDVSVVIQKFNKHQQRADICMLQCKNWHKKSQSINSSSYL